MRRFGLVLSFVLLFAGSALAALHFPTLTGRVVDEAGILSGPTRQNLEQALAAQEQQTTNQVVVVTLRSLEGVTIEDYGYQLGRAWGIGQKGKDNGALLIVAPNERKVRIEVGYGLEGTLTDAISSAIIQGVILPDFRAGHMEQGVTDGTQAILDALGGKNLSRESVVTKHLSFDDYKTIFLLTLFIIFLIGQMLLPKDQDYRIRHPLLTFLFASSGSGSGGGFSGGGFGGGFSGGGGGFGGGGASGGW